MEDLEEIKKAVSTKPLPEPIAAEPLPHEIIDLEKMVQETPKIAPLFVKLEKYKEILENVKNLRETVNRIKILLALKKQIETIDADADDMIFKYMQSL